MTLKEKLIEGLKETSYGFTAGCIFGAVRKTITDPSGDGIGPEVFYQSLAAGPAYGVIRKLPFKGSYNAAVSGGTAFMAGDFLGQIGYYIGRSMFG
jgi:hypothetical protein